MVLGMFELLFVLVLIGGAFVVMLPIAGAIRRGTTPPPPRSLAPGPDPALVKVKDLAWDHRELDTPLADALIGYLNQHERDPDQRAVRNEVAEIAWQHRDTCPDLSVLVIDLLRHPRD